MNTLLIKSLCYPVILSFSVLSISVKADDSHANEEPEEPRLNVGINAMYSDNAFTHYSNSISVLPSVMYEGDKFYARGNQLGYNFSKNKNDEFSVYVKYAGAAYNPKNAKEEYRNLDSKESTAMAGISYLKMSRFGGLQIQGAYDVLGDSKGSTASIAYLSRFTNDNFKLYPSIGVKWQDENYNNHYYGISKKEADKTGIEHYKANASFTPYVNVVGIYDINDTFGLFLNQTMNFYSDVQTDSPKIDGSMTFSSSVGVTYSF